MTLTEFYADQEIKPEIAEILYIKESIVFNLAEAYARLNSIHAEVRRVGGLIHEEVARATRNSGEAYKVVFLSSRESEETFVMPRAVRSDMKTANGKPWGWTLSQRYVSHDDLMRGPKFASQLGLVSDEA
ncbi:hypothetical protein [Cryobacterium serini]|uniref:Uncharacterized protein n=1 Tax=Cryobacterium serini TaxID=1259201 RepID=A0A4V3IXK2_9MICO|nr:hypothetical protein [Cryobacterium serini]TFD91236.1 hypothetical protein E3T51_00535 [Cryobacterium serini]